MKKVIGLLVLLLACFLVSMPVVAESICLSNDLALEIDLWETKTIVQEEVAIQAVAAPDCEMLAVPAAESSIGQSAPVRMVLADGGIEPDSSLYLERLETNYIRSPTGDVS